MGLNFKLNINKTNPDIDRTPIYLDKEDLIGAKTIIEAPEYKIKEDGTIISTKNGKLRKIKPYLSVKKSEVVDLRVEGKYKSFYVNTLINKYFPKPIPKGFVPIKGYCGEYYINKNGEVLSTGILKGNNKGMIILSPIDVNGYLHVNLRKKLVKIHRLVAETFIPNTNNYPQVNHKDENKHNNCVENLEWCDAKYNVNYGTASERRGEKYKKKYKIVNILNNEVYIFNSRLEAANKLQCDKNSITYSFKSGGIIANKYKVIDVWK